MGDRNVFVHSKVVFLLTFVWRLNVPYESMMLQVRSGLLLLCAGLCSLTGAPVLMLCKRLAPRYVRI